MADQRPGPRYIDPDQGAVGRTARDFRRQVAEQDRTATLALSRQYDTIAKQFFAQLDLVLDDIARAEATGQQPMYSLLYRRERLAMLLQDVGRWFDRVDQTIGSTMSPAVQTAVRLGERAAQAAIEARLTGTWTDAPAGSITPPTAPGASIQLNTLPHDAIEELTGTFQEGSPVDELLSAAGAVGKRAAKEILTQGVAQGINPQQLKKGVAAAMQTTVSRALTIARTELWRSYRNATMATYRANDHLVRGWIWRAQLSGTTCAACVAQHGTVHKLDEDMGSHANCRCVCTPITNTWEEIYAKYELTGPRPPERSAAWSTNRPGDAWLRGRSKADQDRVLGSGLAGDLWRSGAVELRDFVVTRRSERWGTSHSRGSAAQAIRKAEKRRLAAGESIESITHRVRALERNEVAEIGQLPTPVLAHWPGITSTRMVITGERLGHLYGSHGETRRLLPSVIETMLDPDEIHRNKEDLDIAIFWKALDGAGDYRMRAAVLVRPGGPGDASVLSARRTRRKDYEREGRQNRKVWEKGA